MKHYDEILDVIKIFIGIVIILSVCIGIGVLEYKNDEQKWNDGICKECGCKWEYQDMYHLRNSGCVYIYCDKNGHSIKIHQNMGK